MEREMAEFGGGSNAAAADVNLRSRSRSSGSSSRRSVQFKEELEEEVVEITLDVADDGSATLLDVGTPAATGAAAGDGGSAAPLGRSVSSLLRQASRGLRRMASAKTPPPPKSLYRSPTSAMRALDGLRFVTSNVGATEGWPAVERRFDQLAVDGVLLRSRFGQCIGDYSSIATTEC